MRTYIGPNGRVFSEYTKEDCMDGTVTIQAGKVMLDNIELKPTADPEERAIQAAMVTIQMMRAKFSTITTGEAWRRLGGMRAVDEWRERTKPIPNGPVTIDLRASEEAIRKSIAMLRTLDPGSKKEFYAKEYGGALPAPRCRCSSCRAAQIIPGVDGNEVEVIVNNLGRCTPSSVAAALKILAGQNGPCAFCAVGPGATHAPYCPFYVGSVPMPSQKRVPAPIPTYTPLPTVSVPGSALGAKTVPAPLPASAPAARPKDSLLNPAPKGFAGSGNLPYDSDYDG